MSGWELAVLVTGLLIAGIAKGVTGMGLPLIATPILTTVFGPRNAVAIIALPLLATNTALMLQDLRRVPELPDLRLFLVMSGIGAAIGTQLLTHLDQRTFTVIVVAMVAVFLVRGDRAAGAGRSFLGPAVA